MREEKGQISIWCNGSKQSYYSDYSGSVWKSLAIKSLRIGWVQGLEAASAKLKSKINMLLIGGLFEDVFPAGYDELQGALDEIYGKNYIALCQRDTHHGRGYTDRFCDMEKEAVSDGAKQGMSIMQEVASKTSLKWLNPRVYNCLYTWWKIDPQDKGMKREPFNMEFTNMPPSILDSHTYEGKQCKIGATLLSGHYFNHRIIAKIVQEEGWTGLRKKFSNEIGR